MDPLTIKLTIDPETAALLDDTKPRSLPMATFCSLLIEQALDKLITLGVQSAAGTPSTSISTSISTDKKKNKTLDIYPGLEKHDESIREFWRVKKGSKSEQGWKLLMTELLKLQRLYGDTVVEEQLQLAANGLWKGVSVRLYEQFKAPMGATAAQAELKHPAYKVFTADKGFDDGPTTNPALEGLF